MTKSQLVTQLVNFATPHAGTESGTVGVELARVIPELDRFEMRPHLGQRDLHKSDVATSNAWGCSRTLCGGLQGK